jgi:ubiquinol-cytochrome c reductase cytochrome b subunit
MMKLTPENGDVVDSAPEFAVQGALLFEKNGCAACHSVNGLGGKIGPPLNGLAGRRNETWVIQHFQNPKMLVPTTSMPGYKFTSTEMQNMVSYLFTLPDRVTVQ